MRLLVSCKQHWLLLKSHHHRCQPAACCTQSGCAHEGMCAHTPHTVSASRRPACHSRHTHKQVDSSWAAHTQHHCEGYKTIGRMQPCRLVVLVLHGAAVQHLTGLPPATQQLDHALLSPHHHQTLLHSPHRCCHPVVSLLQQGVRRQGCCLLLTAP